MYKQTCLINVIIVLLFSKVCPVTLLLMCSLLFSFLWGTKYIVATTFKQYYQQYKHCIFKNFIVKYLIYFMIIVFSICQLQKAFFVKYFQSALISKHLIHRSQVFLQAKCSGRARTDIINKTASRYKQPLKRRQFDTRFRDVQT